jgi:ABC-type Fe3+-hydroxamate transport system substrate-binding protein
MILTQPSLNYKPKRIVSLVPSQTELLYDLGLDAETVGITKFCVHPDEWFRNKARVGGTKSVHIDCVKALEPDLIIANKEENVKEQVEALSEIAPTWVSDIHNLDGAIQMIKDVGELTQTSSKAIEIANKIQYEFDHLYYIKNGYRKVLYLIWHKPWMSVGHDTFINNMLERMGCQNVLKNINRYPELTDEMIQESDASLVFLSSEPFPFKEKHIALIQHLLPNATVKLVDGEMFSWYGSRLTKAPAYFKSLF